MTRKFEMPKKEVKSEDEEKGFGNLWRHDSDDKQNRQSMKVRNVSFSAIWNSYRRWPTDSVIYSSSHSNN